MMASSKLMMKMSSTSSDLNRRNSSNRLHRTNTNSGVFDMTVDGLYTNNEQPQQPPETSLLDAEITLLDAAGAVNDSDAHATVSRGGGKSVDDVWKEIVGGRSCKQEVAEEEMMTLEDFLAKAGAVEEQEEDVKMKIPPFLPTPTPTPTASGSGRMFSFDNSVHHQLDSNNSNVDGFGIDDIAVGRGKRRAILEPLDKAAQQRQRRMIKNRESAARSRERKQAYQAELESLAVKLEEENDMLMKAKAEQTRKRYKQLMENIIPVTEKQRGTRCVLRKVRSMEW